MDAGFVMGAVTGALIVFIIWHTSALATDAKHNKALDFASKRLASFAEKINRQSNELIAKDKKIQELKNYKNYHERLDPGAYSAWRMAQKVKERLLK